MIDAAGNKVKLPRGASDAALLPHHVDRSNFTSWSAFRASSNSMPYALPAPSKARRFPSSMPAAVERVGEEARAAAGCRPDRVTRRSALYSQGQRALSRVRRSRSQPPARLREPRRHRPQVSTVLLEQRGAIHSICHSLSQRDGELPAMGRQPLLECLSRRTRHCSGGTTTVIPEDWHRQPG